MSVPAPFPSHPPFFRVGFAWDAADAYLFDIDGTLLNSRDPVHYRAFQHAIRQVLGCHAEIDGIFVHGNTDVGIVRAMLRRKGLADDTIDAHLPAIAQEMCAAVARNREELQPELCPSIRELLRYLRGRGKLLGAASGNLEPIGWMKLEKAGLRPMFSFGSFSWPRETRSDIFAYGLERARSSLGAKATACVVGDTPSDIEAAKAVAAPVIAIATGVYAYSQLLACGPDACLASAADLPGLNSEL